jgi:hypothetical protein
MINHGAIYHLRAVLQPLHHRARVHVRPEHVQVILRPDARVPDAFSQYLLDGLRAIQVELPRAIPGLDEFCKRGRVTQMSL